MKKIKQKINDIRLQNKLVIIYVVTGLIPLIVLFVFAYCQMRNILMDRDLKSIKGGNWAVCYNGGWADRGV